MGSGKEDGKKENSVRESGGISRGFVISGCH